MRVCRIHESDTNLQSDIPTHQLQEALVQESGSYHNSLTIYASTPVSILTWRNTALHVLNIITVAASRASLFPSVLAILQENYGAILFPYTCFTLQNSDAADPVFRGSYTLFSIFLVGHLFQTGYQQYLIKKLNNGVAHASVLEQEQPVTIEQEQENMAERGHVMQQNSAKSTDAHIWHKVNARFELASAAFEIVEVMILACEAVSSFISLLAKFQSEAEKYKILAPVVSVFMGLSCLLSLPYLYFSYHDLRGAPQNYAEHEDKLGSVAPLGKITAFFMSSCIAFGLSGLCAIIGNLLLGFQQQIGLTVYEEGTKYLGAIAVAINIGTLTVMQYCLSAERAYQIWCWKNAALFGTMRFIYLARIVNSIIFCAAQPPLSADYVVPVYLVMVGLGALNGWQEKRAMSDKFEVAQNFEPPKLLSDITGEEDSVHGVRRSCSGAGRQFASWVRLRYQNMTDGIRYAASNYYRR